MLYDDPSAPVLSTRGLVSWDTQRSWGVRIGHTARSYQAEAGRLGLTTFHSAVRDTSPAVRWFPV